MLCTSKFALIDFRLGNIIETFVFLKWHIIILKTFHEKQKKFIDQTKIFI